MKPTLLILGLMMVLAGCGTGVRAPIEGRADPHAPGQVHIVERELRRDTAIGTPIATRSDTGGILFVTLPIRSAVNQTIPVDYRVTFFDRNGQTLNQTGWLHKRLEANVPDSITVNSMSDQAADFQIDLRQSR